MFEDFKNYMTDVYNKRRSFESVPVDRIFSFYDKDKYSIFSKYVNRAVVLDFGCGNLTLPVAVQETTALYDTYDIDTSNGAAMFHKLSDIPGRYDVIIMFHVCEHYPNFDALYNDLLWIRDHCRTLIICVPNHSGVYDSMGEDMTHKLIINTTDFMCLR
jgi:2-polyprenyl-3-methyl-5-hydroxy-6-metoxy-1,4-benzoquinol methylase